MDKINYLGPIDETVMVDNMYMEKQLMFTMNDDTSSFTVNVITSGIPYHGVCTC